MTIVVKTNAAAAAPKPHKDYLIIKKGKVIRGKQTYTYEYEEKAFVNSHGSDTLEITLRDDEGLRNEGYVFHIHNFCRSHPTAFTRLTSFQTGKPHFPDNTQAVKFSLALAEHELVFLGIIVKLIEPDNGKPIEERTHYLLCDPQVGNDPPQHARSYAPALIF